MLLAIDEVPDRVIARWLAALPDSAQTRAHAFRSARRYRQFVAARHLLTTLLREQLGSAVEIAAKPDGRPGIAGAEAYCSLAHSGSAVMAGFSLLGPVGVDIEQHRPRNFERLVMTYFHPREQKEFAALDRDQREPWFYRLWTRKEACAKALGQGLTLKALASLVPGEGNYFALSSGVRQNYSFAVAHGGVAEVVPRVVSHEGAARLAGEEPFT